MEELDELRKYIESGNYKDALLLLDEMEEMSRDDKINRVASFMEVLLIHLIKQVVEKRTTKSWDISIKNAVRQIVRINKRRKAGGWYLTNEELRQALEEAYESALDSASLEILGGAYTAEMIDAMIDKTKIIEQTLEKVRSCVSNRLI